MSAAALDVIFRSKEGTSNTFKKDANTDFAGNVEQAKEKRFLSTGKTTTNINSKSFLSLHIAVHENSGELANFGAGKNFKDIKKAKGNFFNGGYYGVIQNAFEFPRQQENNEPNIPEVVEFRSSQRLLNPNSNAIASTASAIENVSSHNVPEIESNIINAPTPIENGNDLQINQLQAFEGEIAYSQKLRPTLLFFPRDAETYFCFCIPTKSRSAVFVQCRNCKNSKLWEVLDGRYFVTDPREGHNCTGIGAFQKFSEVRNNDFCHQLQQGIIEAQSVEHLYHLYEIHMGVYLPHKTDEQKRDLKRALAKKYRGEFVLPAVEEPVEAVQEESVEAVQDQHVLEAVQELVHAIEQPTAAVEQPAEVQEEPAFPEQRKRKPSRTNHGAGSPKRPNIDNEVNPEDENSMDGVDNDFDDHPSASSQDRSMFQLTTTPTAKDSTSHAPSTNQQICDTTSTVRQPSPCSKTLSASAPSAEISSLNDFPSSSPAHVPPVISSPTSQAQNSHQNDEEESHISPLEQQSKRTEEESEKTDSQLLLDIDLYKPPSENYTGIDINESIRKLFLSPTPTKLTDEIYEKCLKKAYHGSAVPAVFLPITYYILRAKAKEETLQSPGLLHHDSHVLLFRFDRFYSQGIRCNCQLNTVAFAEKMFEREIIIPLFERGQLISADGKIQKNEFLLPKCLFDVIADGLIRADEVYRQLPNIAEEEVPGFWVSGAQDVMKSFLGCSNRICLTKGKNNELGIKFFALMNALIETTELDDIAQRCYNIVIDRAAFLIVFNKTTGSLACLDGHSHHKSTTGALIALTTKEHLIDFVNVILDEFVPFASGMPVERENVYISCIYPKDPGHSSYGKDGKEQITRLNDHTKPAKILNGQSYNEYVKKLDITCNENGTQVRRVEKAG